MEVGKTLRTLGIDGHDYKEAVGQTADYVPGVAENQDHGAQHALANEEALTRAITSGAAVDRAESVVRAWIASDPATVRLIHEARAIARTTSTVLIRGEAGTGKDLLAWILHALSARADRPLVRVDCASLPPDLIETELFGNEQTTAASPNGFGRLEMAAGGTLVLDEVSVLSIPAQAKLLRLIEERRFERPGGNRPLGRDTRIIALTTNSLEQAVQRRAFREDLYYRLNVIPMVIPPLRDRVADIRPLSARFLERYTEIHRRPRIMLASSVVSALESYAWPGNVRELRNAIEVAVLNTIGNEIAISDLPSNICDSVVGSMGNRASLEDMERNYIAEILAFTRGKKTQAARILGISRKTLLEKRKRYGLS